MGALSSAIDSASQGSTTGAAAAETKEPSILSKATKAISDADKEIGFKETFGTIATSATDLAFQAVDKAVELNDKYKVTDQIVEKISEAADSASKATTSSTSTK